MAVNVKLGVDLSGFKQGMSDANAQLKSFDALLKVAETDFKKTGDAEAAMTNKTTALTGKLEVQKKMVQQYEQQLKKMRDAGIDPASKSYQQLQAAMLNMQAAANETEISLNGLNTSQLKAALSADKLTDSVNSIGKKISLDQVISGINKITDGLENAGKKALQLGENIWNSIMDSARLADDMGTAAMLLDMNVEDYQRYKGVFDTIGEITVSEWMNAKRKIQKAINDPSQDQIDVLSALGISTHETSPGKYEEVNTLARGWEDVFWEAATKLKNNVENGSISQDLADTYADALFGKKAAQMKPLMALGREGFTAALEAQNVASAQAITNDAKLKDTVTKLTDSYDALKMELTNGFAPALTDAANALDGMLGKVIEYIQTENGQEAMGRLSEAVNSLLGDIGKIQPEDVVNNFVSVFESVTSGLEWIVENKDSVVVAMKTIVTGWAGLKLTGGALQMLQLVNGLKNIRLFGGGGEQNTPIITGTGNASKTGILNTLTLFGMAGSYYEGVEGKLKDLLKDFQARTAGMTDAERAKQALIENFNMTEEDYAELSRKLNNGDVSVDVSPELEEGAIQSLKDQIGTLDIPVKFYVPDSENAESGGGGGGGGHNVLQKYANGIPFVPTDNYLAILHKGERVLTASENKSYTVNNNTYLDNVHLHNNMEIDALTERIARNNSRRSRGFGS